MLKSQGSALGTALDFAKESHRGAGKFLCFGEKSQEEDQDQVYIPKGSGLYSKGQLKWI